MVTRTVKDLKREGKVGIMDFSFNVLEEADVHVMSLIMSRIIVLETQSSYFDKKQTYKCVSEDFRPIIEGEVIPHYVVVITTLVDEETKARDYKIEIVEVK